MNRYKLGVKLSCEEYEKSLETRSNRRRAEEYWFVEHLNKGPTYAEERLIETYGLDPDDCDSVFAFEGTFITDDVDLATELYRVLQMDFVHDFKTGLFFFDLFGGHEILMAYLYQDIMKERLAGTNRDLADEWVTRGYGCFKSTQSHKIHIGEDVMIPKYLSQFKHDFRRI